MSAIWKAPLRWLCRAIWNTSEMTGIGLGKAAPWVLGGIMGAQPRKVARLDVEAAIQATASHSSPDPVTVALYTVMVVMNEEDHRLTPERHKHEFAAEMQRAINAGFFTELRYDFLDFDVTDREVLAEIQPVADADG